MCDKHECFIHDDVSECKPMTACAYHITLFNAGKELGKYEEGTPSGDAALERYLIAHRTITHLPCGECDVCRECETDMPMLCETYPYVQV